MNRNIDFAGEVNAGQRWMKSQLGSSFLLANDALIVTVSANWARR